MTPAPEPRDQADFPPYPSGLRLAGRRVLVVGGGHVAQRRVPRLLAAGADVVVVSPVCTPAVEGLAGAGEITWVERGYRAGDVDEAWYVVAATDDPDVNAQVSAEAEAQRIFCVRADDATPGHGLDARGGPARGGHRRGARRTGSPASPPRSGTRSSRASATARSPPRRTRTAPPAWCSSAADRATPSW